MNLKISKVDVTTVAVPIRGELLHSDGAMSRYVVKHILQLHTDDGLVGLGEASSRASAAMISTAGERLLGEDPFNLERIRLAMGSNKFYRMDIATMAAAFQMACLDVQGKSAGRPVADLLGGTLRTAVPLIAYIYRRGETEEYPAVATPDEVVEHTKQVVDNYGFKTIKFKGASASPKEDVEVVRALRSAFPDHLLRLDPNAAWSVETAISVGTNLLGYQLEWLEDPVLGIPAMGEFARRIPIPTATNMCCIQPRELPSTVAEHAVNVVLLDLWYLGGPWSARQMATMCTTFGLGVGVHAGGGVAELGVALAAELHLAASLPGLVHAADSLHHQLDGDVVRAGDISYSDGAVALPAGPGLGVELDWDALGRWSELYSALGPESLREVSGDHPTYPLF